MIESRSNFRKKSACKSGASGGEAFGALTRAGVLPVVVGSLVAASGLVRTFIIFLCQTIASGVPFFVERVKQVVVVLVIYRTKCRAHGADIIQTKHPVVAAQLTLAL